MIQGDMKLPDLERAEILTSEYRPKEWVMDPPSFVWWHVKEEVISHILGIKMKYFAELSQLQAREKEIEAKMFDEMSKAFLKS